MPYGKLMALGLICASAVVILGCVSAAWVLG